MYKSCLKFIIPFLFIQVVFAQDSFQKSYNPLGADEETEFHTYPIILRNRKAVLDRSQLLNYTANNKSINLNLFEDVNFKATLKKSASSSPGSTFLSGSLEQGGHITLFISKEGIVRGEVHSPEGVYTIRTSKGQRGSQEVTIRQIDTSQLPVIDHGAMDVDRLDSSEKSLNWKTTWGSSSFSVIQNGGVSDNVDEEESSDRTVDVLVVYTANAEAHEGGKAEIEATITAEIEKANQAFENSGLSHRKIKLVALGKVDYTQVDNNISDNLQILRDKKGDYSDPDGLLDEVHEMRERYSADLVHLFVERPIGICGIATNYSLRKKGVCRKLL